MEIKETNYKIQWRNLVPFKGVLDYIDRFEENDCSPFTPEQKKAVLLLGLYNGVNLIAASLLVGNGLEHLLR